MLMSSKKHKVVGARLESALPDIVLLAVIENKLQKSEQASFVPTVGPRVVLMNYVRRYTIKAKWINGAHRRVWMP